MKPTEKSHILIFLILILLIGTSFTALSSSKNVSPIGKQGERTINGQILFSPLYGTTTYLIDNTGTLITRGQAVIRQVQLPIGLETTPLCGQYERDFLHKEAQEAVSRE